MSRYPLMITGIAGVLWAAVGQAQVPPGAHSSPHLSQNSHNLQQTITANAQAGARNLQEFNRMANGSGRTPAGGGHVPWHGRWIMTPFGWRQLPGAPAPGMIRPPAPAAPLPSGKLCLRNESPVELEALVQGAGTTKLVKIPAGKVRLVPLPPGEYQVVCRDAFGHEEQSRWDLQPNGRTIVWFR